MVLRLAPARTPHDNGRMRRGRSAGRWWLLAVLVLAMSGCSDVPYFPDRWFQPSPTPGPPAPPAEPDVDLAGVLSTDQGLTATVTTQLWWQEPVRSPVPSRTRPPGWTHVRVPIRGELAVTSTSSGANRAAASVYYELNAAYPLGSRVCELLVPPDDASMVTEGYCWQLLATGTPFSYDQGPPVSLQPGQAQVVTLGSPRRSAGASVDAPEEELGVVAAALRQPSVVVLTTNDIRGLGPTPRFDRDCPGALDGPRPADREQHVLLDSTSPFTCSQLPQLGSGY